MIIMVMGCNIILYMHYITFHRKLHKIIIIVYPGGRGTRSDLFQAIFTRLSILNLQYADVKTVHIIVHFMKVKCYCMNLKFSLITKRT